MHNTFIQDLAAILLTGGVVGWIFKKFLKLPLILGYILAGILLALPISYTPYLVKHDSANTLAEIGVLLLMFSMGLHFGIHKIKTLGFRPIFVGVLQVLLMWFTGTRVAHLFNMHGYEALFLGAVMSIASTAIILKLLEELQLKSSRFAEKLMAVLLVEDSVAIFMIIWLSTAAKGNGVNLFEFFPIFICSIFLWWLLGTILVPRIIHSAFLSGKEELLVILSLGFALGLAYLSSECNFSSALGAFIMGSILSECRELKKIKILIEPVKNIFALVFFVSVGLLFSPQIFLQKWPFILTLVLTIISGKILYNFFLNLLFGQDIKDSLRISGCMGQIGELSFVIAQVGIISKYINEEIFSSIVSAAIITMLITPLSVKIALALADKAEFLLPSSVYKFLQSYSLSVNEFSFENRISPFYKKFSLVQNLKYIIDNIKSRLRKNYLRMTAKNVTATFDRLAPWDEYIVPVHVTEGTGIIGKSLVQLRVREEFGVNVTAIERNNRTIVSPDAKEIILPGDTLLVYGNEESIAKLDRFCTENIEPDESTSLDQCLLAGIKLKEKHPFKDKSILQLGIRNNYNCIVLAVKRDDTRIKNPVSSFVFKENDELFIFCNRLSLQKIQEL